MKKDTPRCGYGHNGSATVGARPRPGAGIPPTHEWVAESRAAAVNFEGNNQACVEKSCACGYEQCMQARGYAPAQQGEDPRFFTSAPPPL